MIKTNPEFIPEAMHEPVRENLLSDRSIDNGINSTHERINNIVRTTTPSAPHPAPVTSPTPAPVPAPSTDASASTKAKHVLHAEGSGTPHTDEPKNFARNATIGVAATTAALAALPSWITTQLPLIGKIPYLPQAITALQNGLGSLVSPLGLGTGVNATNPILASFYNFVGPVAASGLAIPAGLWLGGIIDGLITGKRHGGIMGNINAATKRIVELPFWPYELAMSARAKAGKLASSTWNIAKTPVVGAWNLTKNIATSAWHTTATTTSNVLKPTKLGVGGAILGGILAAATAGAAAPAIAAAGLGYGFSNWLKNSGAMNGSGSAAAAHAH